MLSSAGYRFYPGAGERICKYTYINVDLNEADEGDKQNNDIQLHQLVDGINILQYQILIDFEYSILEH